MERDKVLKSEEHIKHFIQVCNALDLSFPVGDFLRLGWTVEKLRALGWTGGKNKFNFTFKPKK